MSKITIDATIVLAKLSDGTIRQVVIGKETEEMVSRLIEQVEDGFKVSSQILEGIQIRTNGEIE